MNKTILITGTSSGIGRAIAAHLSALGHTVIGTSRKPKRNNGSIPQLKLDVTDDSSVSACFDTIRHEYGHIDVLINNAGIVLAGSIEDSSMAEAQSQLDTNYFGVVRMIRYVIPMMRDQKDGLIINISSIAGMMGVPFQGHYAASKFAIEGLTETLRHELKPFNIRVTNINPGDFKTEITDNRWFAKSSSDAYQPQFQTVLEKYETGEREGADPILIAKLVEKLIIKKGTPHIRHVVGKFDQKIFMSLKRILGSRLFEKSLAKILEI